MNNNDIIQNNNNKNINSDENNNDSTDNNSNINVNVKNQTSDNIINDNINNKSANEPNTSTIDTNKDNANNIDNSNKRKRRRSIDKDQESHISELLTNKNEKTTVIKRFKLFNIKIKNQYTYYEAMNSKYREEWLISIEIELNNMYDNKVMQIVDQYKVPEYINIIDTLWILTIKCDGTKKARLVARGC